MTAVLPETLYRTKRGLCPGCGAPLALAADAPTTRCGFCGGEAVLERRLRKVEPDVAGAPLRLYFDGDEADAETKGGPVKGRWVRSKQFRQADVERAVCPGCGDEIEYADDHAAITCRSCGTDCRVERRLRAPRPDPAREVPHPRRKDERRHERPADADPDTEQIIYRIVTEPDFEKQIVLARSLSDNWCYVNKTCARLLPALFRHMRGADERLQYVLSQVVCKLLCEGDPALRNAAVQAAERVIFDVSAPRPLVFEVGMGDGVCLKPLLDAAEFAVRRGDLEYACAALLGIDWIFQRNFQHHQVMGDIILYRMLYLTGPTLAFALLLAQRQVTGTGFYYPAETLLRFIDDAAVERPVLVPELAKSFYVGWPQNTGEFLGRISFYKTLRTDAARDAALRQWLMLPENPPGPLAGQFVRFLTPLLDHPTLAEAAADALYLVAARSPLPQAIHDLVRERGDGLPAEVRRAYFRECPDTPHLSREKLPYWNPKPEPGLSPEMQQALGQWKAGLTAADRRNREIRDAYSTYWKTVTDRDVPIYDEDDAVVGGGRRRKRDARGPSGDR